MSDTHLTELQRVILEVEQLGLPRRDAMRLVTQRVGFFVGQQRYAEELSKALKILAGQPAPATGTETAREDSGERTRPGPPREPTSATHQIGSTGG
jgi:hypothetical protein